MLFSLVFLKLVAFVPVMDAVVELGDYGALALDTTVGVEYSSNIARNSEELEDFIFFAEPLVRYRFDEGALKVEANVGLELLRYDDFGENDAENIVSRIIVEYPHGDYGDARRYDLLLDMGYREQTAPNESVQAIAETERFDMKFIGRYYVSDRTFLRGGIEYVSTQSETASFEDVETMMVPFEVYYDYSDELAIGVGYFFVDTDVQGDAPQADSNDHGFFVGGEGQLAPSVNGTVEMGWQERNFDHSSFDDTSAFFMDASLDWELATPTVVILSAGNLFDTTIDNESSETLYLELEVEHEFEDKIRGSLGAGYEEEDFSDGREDEEWYGFATLDYSLIEDISDFAVQLKYSDRESNDSDSTYEALSLLFEISYLF